MTTVETVGVENVAGPYWDRAVDWIERYYVTDAMVDLAIRRANPDQPTIIADPQRRAKARRNIAIGIRAGAYQPE